MCRWGLIAYPAQFKYRDKKIHLLLGEVYDSSLREDKNRLLEFYCDLNYLTPFRYCYRKGEGYCSNSPDLDFIRKKYGLTFKTSFSIPEEKQSLIFHSPFLYDLDCKVPIFPIKEKICYTLRNNKVCILLPYYALDKRGKLIKEAISYGPEIFILCGKSEKDGMDSIVNLAYRQLLLRKVPKSSIIKAENKELSEIIRDVNKMLNRIPDIILACHSEDVSVSLHIRKLRRLGTIPNIITYIFPF